MKTLFEIYSVPIKFYAEKETEIFVETKAKKGSTKTTKVKRELDYFLSDGKQLRCEVKLIGAGNSESADAIYARNSDIFIADSLSEQNKEQLNDADVAWIELRTENCYKKFADLLRRFNIPFKDFDGDIDEKLKTILDKILP